MRDNIGVIALFYFLIELTEKFRSKLLERKEDGIKVKLKKLLCEIPYSYQNIARLILLFFIALSFIQIALIGPVFFTSIRYYATGLTITGNFYLQTLLIPLTILLTFIGYFSENNNTRIVNSTIVLLMWLVFIVSGFRKELFIFLMSLVLIGLIDIKKYYKIGFLVAIIILGLPLVRQGFIVTSSFLTSFHEFVLPQYTQAIVEYNIDDYERAEILSKSGMINGIGAMVPSFLRVLPYQPIGVSILDLPSVHVGLGVHPFAEFILNFGKYWKIAFITICFLGYNVVFIIGKKFPEILLISFGYFAVYGRSDVWLTAFFIVYSTFFLTLFTRKYKFKAGNG